VEDVELPNSCTVVEVNLDEIPLISSVNSPMLHSPTAKVCPFHVIFNPNGIMITTCFNKCSCTIIFRHGLKEFLEKCLMQFQVYIWFATQGHNIYNYLNQIYHKTLISIHASKVLDQIFCMWNPHFLLDKPNKPIFHKNLDVFFSTFPYTRTGNTLLIDDAPYKSKFNNIYNSIFLKSFDGLHGEDQCLLRYVLSYLENLDLFGYDVPTFVEHNPLGRIRCIDQNNLALFKMLFVKCSHTCQPTFCNNVKLKLKQKVHY
jgi:hypothetical protein